MRKRAVMLLIVLGMLAGGGVAFGQFSAEVAPDQETVELFRDSLDIIWLALGAALVLFMQAGFGSRAVVNRGPGHQGSIRVVCRLDCCAL